MADESPPAGNLYIKLLREQGYTFAGQGYFGDDLVAYTAILRHLCGGTLGAEGIVYSDCRGGHGAYIVVPDIEVMLQQHTASGIY